ncbi:hypothetical protein EVAR_8633_1 [Eumeta japonica]|uniref:Uncharacterized protein n=1 Tax=Eumeta variegata TaxID=151549 RepID=A0A4C1TUD6_EUMVA|nr:hypothetical protein EVAR_8633_1 [Eumeta japonica]
MTRKTNTNTSSLPSEKPLLKRLYKKSQNIVSVKVSPFPKEANSVIADEEAKKIANCTNSTPKEKSLKSNESNTVKQGRRRLNLKNGASQVIPAMKQVGGTTSLLPVTECTLVKKRKGRPRIKKSPVQETTRDLNTDHKRELKNEEELAPTLINSGTLTESKVTLQVKKQQECDANCQEVGNKRKRKPTITCTNNIKDVKRQKINRIKYSSKVIDSNVLGIEKAATIIEQRLADLEHNILSSDVVLTCASKVFIDKSQSLKTRALKIPLEPDSCRTFASLKKKGRKKKLLESDSCKTFVSHKSSSISDTFSWTKEISSSSASFVTVTSNDYVCIDRKLPIIKLYDVERSSPDTTMKTLEPIKTHTQKMTSLSETDTESSAEYTKFTSRLAKFPSNILGCSSHNQSNDFIHIPKIPDPTLNLSTTTSPSQYQIPSTTEVTTENDTDVTSDTDISKSKFIEKYLENIQPHYERETADKDLSDTILKRLDLDFIECLSIGNTQVVDINDKSYKACSELLNAEVATIDDCRIIKKQLSQILFNNKENSQGDILYYQDYLERQSTPAEENTSKENDNGKMPHSNDTQKLLEDSNGNKKSLDATCHNYDDDDDTLSLFAESIDLNRFNHSIANEKNPTKISDEPSQKTAYCKGYRTKIRRSNSKQ